MALPEYLDSDQLERLKKHKYKSQGISVLEVRPEAVHAPAATIVLCRVQACSMYMYMEQLSMRK